jgi:ATP-dependent Clp protease protease subunit
MPSRLIVDGEIILYGLVGGGFMAELLGEASFNSREVIQALSEIGHGQDITVRLNSAGGDPWEGVAIYNALVAHGGNVEIIVDALCGSAASVISCAGSPTLMRPGTVLMVHDPRRGANGNEDDMRAAADMLSTVATAMAEIYAEKTGRPIAKVRAEMKQELWMTADDAVKNKYADGRTEPLGEPLQVAAFNYNLFEHAPKELRALADSKGWTKQFRAYAEPGEQPPKNGKSGVKGKKNHDRLAASARTDDHGREQTGAGNDEESDAMIDEVEKKKLVDAAKAEAKKEAATEQATALAAAQATATAIIKAAADGGVPKMAAALISKGLTLEQAKAKIEEATKIKAKVDSAHAMCPAIDPKVFDEYIEAGASIEHVGNDLLDRMAKASAGTTQRSQHSGVIPPTNNIPAGVPSTTPDGLNAYAIYNKREKERLERTNGGRNISTTQASALR